MQRTKRKLVGYLRTASTTVQPVIDEETSRIILESPDNTDFLPPTVTRFWEGEVLDHDGTVPHKEAVEEVARMELEGACRRYGLVRDAWDGERWERAI